MIQCHNCTAVARGGFSWISVRVEEECAEEEWIHYCRKEANDVAR